MFISTTIIKNSFKFISALYLKLSWTQYHSYKSKKKSMYLETLSKLNCPDAF